MKKSIFLPVLILGTIILSSSHSITFAGSKSAMDSMNWKQAFQYGWVCPSGYIDYFELVWDIEYQGGCVPLNLLSQAEKKKYAIALKKFEQKPKQKSVPKKAQENTNTAIADKISVALLDNNQIMRQFWVDVQKIFISLASGKASSDTLKKAQILKQKLQDYKKELQSNISSLSKVQDISRKKDLEGRINGIIKIIDGHIAMINDSLWIPNETTQGKNSPTKSTSVNKTNQTTACNNKSVSWGIDNWCPVVGGKFTYTWPKIITKTGEVNITGKYYKNAQIKILLDDVDMKQDFLVWEDGTVQTKVNIKNWKTIKIIDKVTWDTLFTIKIQIPTISSTIQVWANKSWSGSTQQSGNTANGEIATDPFVDSLNWSGNYIWRILSEKERLEIQKNLAEQNKQLKLFIQKWGHIYQ